MLLKYTTITVDQQNPGKMTTSGRRAFEFVVESCSGELSLELPTLIECDNLPDNRHEIPTSDVAKSRSSYFLRVRDDAWTDYSLGNYFARELRKVLKG